MHPVAAAAATDLVTEWVHGTLILAASDLPLPDGISLVGYPRTAAMLTGTAAGTGPGSDSASRPEGELTSLDLVVRAVTARSD